MVLACKYVDDVIVGAPYQISSDLIKSLNIKTVVNANTKEDEILEVYRHIDPSKIPKEMGIFNEIEIDTDITVEVIAQRVVENREKYRAKYEKKIA